jgi:hypothetical protein
MNCAHRCHSAGQRFTRAILRTAIICNLIALSCIGAFAQALTSLSGSVSDATGAVVPNVNITIEDVNRGFSRPAVTDDVGRYGFPQIPPGRYRLVAKAAGFADVVIDPVELAVNSPATVNIVLQQIKGVTETVTVNAETIQVNTTDASLGNAVGTREVLQVPLYLRNVVGLLAFQPGVTVFNESTTDERNGSVNGGRADQANVTLDGIDVNDVHQRRAFTSVIRLSLDSVSEFRTTTSNAGADQGRTSGAEIALVTKSGTNDLHGSFTTSIATLPPRLIPFSITRPAFGALRFWWTCSARRQAARSGRTGCLSLGIMRAAGIGVVPGLCEGCPRARCARESFNTERPRMPSRV